MPRNILIFDFDGTVCLGDGPLTAYAEEIAAQAGSAVPGGGEDLLSRLVAGIDAPADALDGYDLIARRARTAGIAQDTLNEAYLRSRGRLAEASCAVSVPQGLHALLDRAAHGAERVLATNAPNIGLAEALERLGLSGLFDTIHTRVGKPEGLAELLDAYPEGSRILSIGDIWHNDLAPAQARGHSTALVGRGDVPEGASPSVRAESIAELGSAIDAWLSGEDLTVTTTPSSLCSADPDHLPVPHPRQGASCTASTVSPDLPPSARRWS